MGLLARVLSYPAYLAEAALHPRRMCAIAPTSAAVLEEVCREIRGSLQRFVNIGAGTGDLEAMLIDQGKVAPGGQMIAVEPSWLLSTLIRPMANGDKRVHVIQAMFNEALNEIWRKFALAGGLAEEIATSVPLSKFAPEDLQGFLQHTYDITEPDGGLTAFIIRDMGDEIRKVYPHVSVRDVKGHKFPPMTYRVHRALKKRPVLRVYDSAMMERSIHDITPAMAPGEPDTDAPSPA